DLFTAAVSATSTGVLGILRGQEHYGVLAGAAALNSGITAAAFFSLREFIVSPILVYTMPTEQYERRRRELGIDTSSPEAENKTSTTPNPQLSSMRGRKVLDSAVSGAATGALLRGWKSGPRAVLPGAITVGTVCTLLQLGYNEFGIQRLKYVSRQHTSETDPQTTPIPQTIILSLMGVRKVSEDEYLARLRLQREHYLLKIKELERKVEEEK
ncbi:hypothetical protein P691DRAFT_654045, partial [Macrolepiota fuliginosa MF-IS2]